MLSHFSYHYTQIHKEQLFLPYISIQLLCTSFHVHPTIYLFLYDKKENILKLLRLFSTSYYLKCCLLMLSTGNFQHDRDFLMKSWAHCHRDWKWLAVLTVKTECKGLCYEQVLISSKVRFPMMVLLLCSVNPGEIQGSTLRPGTAIHCSHASMKYAHRSILSRTMWRCRMIIDVRNLTDNFSASLI